MGIFSRKTKDQKITDDKVKSDKLVVDKKTEVEKIVSKKTRPKTEVKKPVVKTATKSKKKIATVKAYKILIKPIISEKATIGVSLNKYVFEVSPKANKVEIKKAIEEVYKVVPQAVNIINRAGRRVRFGRNMGSTKFTKKAIVTLKKGDTIKLYEGI